LGLWLNRKYNFFKWGNLFALISNTTRYSHVEFTLSAD
jgi:hypothetical protein